jgi:hypothetical protein
MLKNELDWIVRRDIWRAKAQEIRAEFERNRWVQTVTALCFSFVHATDFLEWHCRNVHDPRSLAIILHKAEEELASKLHPDPYIGAFKYFMHSIRDLHLYDAILEPTAPGGTKWSAHLNCSMYSDPLTCNLSSEGSAIYPYVLSIPCR